MATPFYIPSLACRSNICYRTVVHFCPRYSLSFIVLVLLHTLCGACAVLRRRAIRIVLRFCQIPQGFCWHCVSCWTAPWICKFISEVLRKRSLNSSQINENDALGTPASLWKTCWPHGCTQGPLKLVFSNFLNAQSGSRHRFLRNYDDSGRHFGVHWILKGSPKSLKFS